MRYTNLRTHSLTHTHSLPSAVDLLYNEVLSVGLHIRSEAYNKSTTSRSNGSGNYTLRPEGGGHSPLPQIVAGPPNLAVLSTHCGQLILRKISKFDAIRYQTLRLECTKFDFRWAGPIGYF